MRGTATSFGRSLLLALLLGSVTAAAVAGPVETGNRTVIGPSNLDLYDGAQLLLAGDYDEGIARTERGLAAAANTRERLAGLSNLCAGYLNRREFERALDYCNRALALDGGYWRALCNRAVIYTRLGRYDEAGADLDAAEAIAPQSRTLELARSQWRDATDPVQPTVIIDDRRDGDDDAP